MSWSVHLSALACVALVAAGQVLFKLAAQALAAAGSPLDRGVAALAGPALLIYGIAAVTWIALLQRAPLGRLYPYMALSFVLVALASRQLLGEPGGVRQIAGLGLIVGGLLVMAAE